MKTAITHTFYPVWIMAALILAAPLMAQDSPVQDSPAPDATDTNVPPPSTAPVAATLPADIQPGSPLSQILKLTQAGVDESIIQAYVTNSASTFNLTSDQIIYLKDDGVPDDLVAGMMRHDYVIQAQIAAANPPPEPAAAPAIPPTPTPPPMTDAPVTNDVSTPDDQTADSITVPDTDVTVDDFYNDLSAYGNWVAVDGYGNCWLPGVAVYNPSWQPYGDHGHWAYTDSGWYWVSDYSWGWAPFHYGRWFRSPRFGWCWRPDTIWSPSWVTWRYADGYCGWAPLPPGAFYSDSGFVYNGALVAADYDFGLDSDTFVFVSTANFCDPHPYRHRFGRDQASAAWHHSTVLNSFQPGSHGYVNRGIPPAHITAVTHRPIRTVPLRDKPLMGGRSVYAASPFHNQGTVYAPRAQFAGPSAPEYNHNTGPNSAGPTPVSRPHPVPATGNQDNRYNPAPRPVPNYNYQYNNNEPASAARSYTPAPVYYRPATPAPEPGADYPVMERRAEPPNASYPVSAPRPEQPAPQFVERPQRVEPQPAPARSNPEPAPAHTSNNSNQKTGPH